MSPSVPTPLSLLRSLLHSSGQPAEQRVAELAAARMAVAGHGELARAMLAAELRWLRTVVPAGVNDAATALAQAERAALARRIEWLAQGGGGEAAIPFDLADAMVAGRQLGAEDLVLAAQQALQRATATAVASPRLRQEAQERIAALVAAVEDLPLAYQVALLHAHGSLLQQLAQATKDAWYRRSGARLLRIGEDRELARRLEQRFGRRGVALLETANFVLLLLVLGILLVTALVELPAGTLVVLQWIDALACLFFVVDFAVEFALHPRRGSWFVRNAVTDLLPAVPSVLFLLPVLGAAPEGLGAVRLLRLLRVTWAARYVQALRPLWRSARLLLFLVRGLDGLTLRFANLLNREFVLVAGAVEMATLDPDAERRELVFAALHEEQALVAALPAGQRLPWLQQRAAAAAAATMALRLPRSEPPPAAQGAREVALEHVIEVLWSLRPQDLGRWLRANDVRALARVVRVVSAAPVRWLPIVRAFAVWPVPEAAEDRVVGLAHRVAAVLEAWHGRLLFYADLHGIVTGPQILDRVATAMVKATQRPAVRLLLFGGLFVIFEQLIGWHSDFLSKIVATPLLVLGSVCLVFLSLGRWLKRIAGEAAEAYRLTSEAHFLPQLERLKLQFQAADLPFLARRVFGPEAPLPALVGQLQRQLQAGGCGVPLVADGPAACWANECSRVGLLYLHYLDGAPLHATDGKTTEQLLANRSLENLRAQLLRPTRRERQQLRRLKLDDGSLFGGPFLWFSFITESLAVEVAKRIEGYNRFCLPLTSLPDASAAQRAAMQEWLQRRLDPKAGRTVVRPPRERQLLWATTEFHALDFAAADPERDAWLAQQFGAEVLAVLQRDRRNMMREIFGMRAIHRLSRQDRSFNPLRFYRQRLSRGRVLLAPLWLFWSFLQQLAWLVVRVRQIVREVFDPELASARREAGVAPFAVALRKIHRMKAPGLLAAMEMRLRLDPVYAGAPAGWTAATCSAAPEAPPVEADLAFLHLHERAASSLRERAAGVRQLVLELHANLEALGAWPAVPDAAARSAGELAATCAWITDADGVRTLWAADRWQREVLPQWLAEGVQGPLAADLWHWLCGRFVVPVTERWADRHAPELTAPQRRWLRRAYAQDRAGCRGVLRALAELPPGTAARDAARERLHRFFRRGPSLRSDLLALRAIQSLTVLDIRNYRAVVFRVGAYAEDGEDERLATALPRDGTGPASGLG